MSDRSTPRAARPLLILGLMALAACSYQPRFMGRPGVPEGPPAGMAMDHEIRYDVFCQKCEVAYTHGSEMRHAEVTGTWSTTVRLESPSVRMVTLRAWPTREGTFVRRARIYVNGMEAAEAERFGRSEGDDEILLTAALPGTSGVSARFGR